MPDGTSQVTPFEQLELRKPLKCVYKFCDKVIYFL